MLLHTKNSSNNNSGYNKKSIQDIVLIHIKSPDKQAVIDAISELRDDPYVVYAEPDYLMETDIVTNDPYYDRLWGLEKISAPKAWDTFTGSDNVVVGVIDSGVYYDHPDMKNNMWIVPGTPDVFGWDFYYDNYDSRDQTGHGTHVAGTVGAVGNNNIGTTGVNLNVQIASFKIGGDSDSVCSTAAIKAIEYSGRNNIPILNNSWGGRHYCETLKSAIEQYDGLFIASAGNNSTNNDIESHFPSTYGCENIISVAATDQNDELASFSNYGAATVHIAAPGTEIYSPLLNGEYGYKNGTSMAAPHVAGAAALLKGYMPHLTALQIKDIILSSADKVPQLNGKVITGGRLNINAMLELAASMDKH